MSRLVASEGLADFDLWTTNESAAERKFYVFEKLVKLHRARNSKVRRLNELLSLSYVGVWF